MIETLILSTFATTAISLCSLNASDKIVIDGVEYTLVYPSAVDQESPPPKEQPWKEDAAQKKKKSARRLRYISYGMMGGGGLLMMGTAFLAFYMGEWFDELWTSFIAGGVILIAGGVLGVIAWRKSGWRLRRSRRVALTPWAAPDSGGLKMIVTW